MAVVLIVTMMLRMKRSEYCWLLLLCRRFLLSLVACDSLMDAEQGEVIIPLSALVQDEHTGGPQAEVSRDLVVWSSQSSFLYYVDGEATCFFAMVPADH